MQSRRVVRDETRAERGGALVFALLALVMVVGLSTVILSASYRQNGEVNAEVQQNRAFLAAQAGAHMALSQLAGGEEGPLGSADAPVAFGGNSYWVDFVDNKDSTRTLTSFGSAGLARSALEIQVVVESGGVFAHGLFAGNSSNDPNYTLQLGGTAGDADEVIGDVYSGGDIDIQGDASVDGTMRALGTASGNGAAGAETGKAQPIPDLAAMNYEATAGVKVSDEFATGGAVYTSDDAGGKAWHLPEANPAHIFRKNPDDRTDETSSTVKDDYFLEDPYEKVMSDKGMNGSAAYQMTLSGTGSAPGVSSNQMVFFIDGNLWLHNLQSYSLALASPDASGLQVTFVVKGNIYIADNFFYDNEKKDGVAFIAMKDSKVPDSGNIYLGDPEYGTLKSMSGFLYAEEDFYDFNLDETGSTKVELHGNMTAGDQILIDRDYTIRVTKKTYKTVHTKLTIEFDERIANGELDLPGLPGNQGGDGEGYQVLSWREVAQN